MKERNLRDYQAYLLLILFAVLAYWPMSFMMFSAKNDAIHFFLAMRYNTSEMVQNGIFPAWSPYINLGYPVHGDIQSGVWNPFVFLMSAIRQYDIYWLHTEIILINVLAGIGMYRLLRFLELNKKTALVIGTAYMLNGYMTDAGQFLNWLYAGALLPFVVLFAFKAFRSFTFRDGFGLGASFSLLLLCGYPADTILAAYLLLAWFIFSLVRHRSKEGLPVSLKKHLRVGAIAFFSFLIICLPALISFLEFFPEVKRGAGVTLELAQSNSLAPANLVSLVFPWMTLKGQAFAGTDPLIRNCFIGLITLIFFILFFIQKRKWEPWQKFLAWCALFFFIFSLGKHTPLREWAYDIIPLMDSFRHPANAKLFYLFVAQVFAGLAIHRYLNDDGEDEKKIKAINYVMLSISALALLLALVKSQALKLIGEIIRSGGMDLSDKLKSDRDGLGTMDLLFLNALFALFILITAYILVKRRSLKKYLVPLVFVEMFIAAQLMLPLTYVRNFKPSQVQQLLDAQPRGYPIPDLSATIEENSSDGMSTFEQIGCLNVYNKKIGRVDYIITPSNLASQEDFWDKTAVRQPALKNPVLFLTDSINSGDNTWMVNATDTSTDKGTIVIHSFHPQEIRIITSSSKPRHLILMENYYHRWKASVDKSPVPVKKVNGTFMAVELAAGKNQVVLSYRTNDLEWMAVFSLIFFIVGVFFYFFKRKNKRVEP